MVSDAEVLTDVAHRWKDFSKETEPYRTLAFFGQNVVTSEGALWQQHRKITGPPFNEKNSSLVFKESLMQGKAMLASFTSDANGQRSVPGEEPVIDDLLRWTMTITLHVLSGAAFTLKIPWPTKSVVATSTDPKEVGPASKYTGSHSMSFQESVVKLMTYLPIIIFFPAWSLRFSPLSFMRKMQHVADEFRAYMTELISDNMSSGGGDRGDLLGSIVRASTDQKISWSDEDTIGNIFVIILAGHETTGSTIQNAIVLLACYPEYQQQVQAELDTIWGSRNSDEDWVYADHPKMRLIMALMLETLRRYAPVNLLPKHTTEAQTVEYRGQTIQIPADTDVNLAIVATQHNPKYWSEDAWEFRPSRWLMPLGYIAPPNSSNEAPGFQDILCPPKGSFVAFSAGFRACLGKKFAQVEFCTLIAVLFKDYSVELVRESPNEKWEDAKKRAMDQMHDRNTMISTRMVGKVKVKFVKRGSESFPPRV